MFLQMAYSVLITRFSKWTKQKEAFKVISKFISNVL